MQKKIASLCREKLFCFKWGSLHPKKKYAPHRMEEAILL